MRVSGAFMALVATSGCVWVEDGAQQPSPTPASCQVADAQTTELTFLAYPGVHAIDFETGETDGDPAFGDLWVSEYGGLNAARGITQSASCLAQVGDAPETGYFTEVSAATGGVVVRTDRQYIAVSIVPGTAAAPSWTLTWVPIRGTSFVSASEPQRGCVGQAVEIVGYFGHHAPQVDFGGVSATPDESADPFRILVPVPPGAQDGITVRTPSGDVTAPFNVVDPCETSKLAFISANSTIRLFDTESGTPEGLLDSSGFFGTIAIDGPANRLYVGIPDAMQAYDSRTLLPVGAEIPLDGADDWNLSIAVAISTSSDRIFATRGRSLLLIDETIDEIRSVVMPYWLVDVAEDPSTGLVYASSYSGNSIHVVDPSWPVEIALITTGLPSGNPPGSTVPSGGPRGIAVVPAHGRAYVVLAQSGTLGVIDLATNTLETEFPFGPISSEDVAYDAMTDRLFVGVYPNAVLALDPETGAILAGAPYPNPPDYSYSPLVAANGLVYVAAADGVRVLDAIDLSTVATLPPTSVRDIAIAQ